MTRQDRAQEYLERVCAALGNSRVPLLLFRDNLQNAGACGEAGQSTIWLHSQFVDSAGWEQVKQTVRHEMAHIVVANTPGMGEVPAHGQEFRDALRHIGEETRDIGSMGKDAWIALLAVAGVIALVAGIAGLVVVLGNRAGG